ncbi:hypothetical protein KC722_00390 [Candidatus Kaiserbacteria bacterium]|nr:hypothetical protein [Candidatus Kaiserbacteria bacterium]MCB9811946.1 hypothetical protein [Candidatus Nomurabacteria bacterium]
MKKMLLAACAALMLTTTMSVPSYAWDPNHDNYQCGWCLPGQQRWNNQRRTTTTWQHFERRTTVQRETYVYREQPSQPSVVYHHYERRNNGDAAAAIALGLGAIALGAAIANQRQVESGVWYDPNYRQCPPPGVVKDVRDGLALCSVPTVQR